MSRVTFVTLGVMELPRSRSFFEQLFGWKPLPMSNEHIAFYDQGGWALALFPREHLASDVTVPAAGSGFPGFTVAHNVRTRADVAPLLARAVELGARLVKPAQDVFWGGHSGYFQDPDGHYWEIAWNPFVGICADGKMEFPKGT